MKGGFVALVGWLVFGVCGGEGVGPEEGCGDAYPSVVAGWSFDFAGVVFVAGALYFVVEDVEGEYEGGGGEGEDGDRHLGLLIGCRLLLF